MTEALKPPLMSDRKLLELAAKAAGYSLLWGNTCEIGGDVVDCTDLAWAKQASPDEAPVLWNPLDDDGDALRLSVRLHIDLELNNGSVSAVWIDSALSETHVVKERCDEFFEGWQAKEAATRRAIVRAAAQIGEHHE